MRSEWYMTDLRTIEKIEYGHTSARRLALTPYVCRELEKRYIAFDTETTGLDPESDRIVEFGAVLFESGVPADSFQCYINPGVSISEEVSALNHISNEILQTAPSEAVAYREFLDFIGDAANSGTILCGHVVAFDLSFLCRRMNELRLTGHFRFIDTRQLAVRIPELEHHSLGAVAQHFGIPHEMAHHAREDALTSGRILWRILGKGAVALRCGSPPLFQMKRQKTYRTPGRPYYQAFPGVFLCAQSYCDI